MMTRARLTEAEGRAALLTAATEIVNETGSPNLTVREVAARAGINHGLVHRYFGTKDTLISAVIDEISAALATDLARPGGGERAIHADATGTLAQLIGHAMISGGDDVGARGRAHPVADLIVQRLRDQGDLSEHDARVAAAQILALTLGWRLNERFLVSACGLDDDDLEGLRDQLYNACLRVASDVTPRVGATAETF
jgi:TetR/AcrR family transcriptional regulator, repressor for neighboring sulfatase